MQAFTKIPAVLLISVLIAFSFGCDDDDNGASPSDNDNDQGSEELKGDWDLLTFEYLEYDEEDGELLDDHILEYEEGDYIQFLDDDVLVRHIDNDTDTSSYEILSGSRVEIDLYNQGNPLIYDYEISSGELIMKFEGERSTNQGTRWIEETIKASR